MAVIMARELGLLLHRGPAVGDGCGCDSLYLSP